MKKFKITRGDRVYIVDAKSHIDAINKVKSIKDSGINYGTLFIDLNSPNELTASRIVQELKNEIGNNKIAEIRGGSFTPLREYGSASLDLDFKEFKNNEWGTNHIRLMVRSALSLPVLTKMKEDPKSAYKLRAELNNKLKQFANKTIYSNKSFTMDSAIRDYSPEVYIKELEKLIPEYQRLDNIRQKIIDSLKSSGKIDMDTWRKYDYLSDAKVKQWIKQVRELDKKWNKLLDNLSRFKGTQSYRRDNKSDRDIWFDDVPYPREIKGIQGDVAIIGLLSGSKNKDSISQWKPGMSEIGLFQISYKKGTVNQSILVKATTKEDAINKFTKHKPDAEVIGVNEYPNPHFGEPILDSKIKDEDYSKYLSIVKQLEKLVEPANRAFQQKFEKYGVTKQDIRNNSPKYRDVCREIPELKVWAKLIMQLPGVLQGTMSAYPSQESVDKLKKVVTNGKAFDSTIKDSYGWSYIMAPMKTPGDKDLNILRNLRSTYYDDMYQDVYNIRKAFAKATNKRVAINMAKDMPEYAKFIRTLDSADKDWNAIISKYPSLKKFKINTTGAERLLYGYYPTLKDFVDEITPVIKKEW